VLRLSEQIREAERRMRVPLLGLFATGVSGTQLHATDTPAVGKTQQIIKDGWERVAVADRNYDGVVDAAA
jgi:hypothetical protein